MRRLGPGMAWRRGGRHGVWYGGGAALRQTEKHRERPVNRQHRLAVETADGWAEFQAADRLRSIDRDLGRDPQSVRRVGRDVDPSHGRPEQSAGQRQNNDGGEGVEPVRLDNDGGARFTAVAVQRDDDDVAPAYQPRSSQASALARSQNSASSWALVEVPAFAMASH